MSFNVLSYVTLFNIVFVFVFTSLVQKSLGLVFSKGQSIHTFYCDDDTKALKQTLNICSYFVSLYIAMNCAFFKKFLQWNIPSAIVLFVCSAHALYNHDPETNKDLFILSLECAALVESLWFT